MRRLLCCIFQDPSPDYIPLVSTRYSGKLSKVSNALSVHSEFVTFLVGIVCCHVKQKGWKGLWILYKWCQNKVMQLHHHHIMVPLSIPTHTLQFLKSQSHFYLSVAGNCPFWDICGSSLATCFLSKPVPTPAISPQQVFILERLPCWVLWP